MGHMDIRRWGRSQSSWGKPGRRSRDAGDADQPENDGESGEGIPVPLQNWRVLEETIEIEGEARIGEAVSIDVPPAQSQANASAAPSRLIQDQVDEIVIVTLAARRVEVAPGEEGRVEVSVLNNGPQAALFEVTVEGWVDERWFGQLPLHIQLQPGERSLAFLTVTPPRLPSIAAGEHHFVVCVRSPDYVGHVGRAGAVLVIRGYEDVRLGLPQPGALAVSWFRRSGTTVVPVMNSGNQSVQVQLHGVDRGRRCAFEFRVPAAAGGIAPQTGQASLHVRAGTTVHVPVQVTVQECSLMGLRKEIVPFRIVAQMEAPSRSDKEAADGASSSRVRASSVEGHLACAPLIGPWQMISAAVLMMAVLVGGTLVGLTFLLALRQSMAVQAAPAVSAALAAPVVEQPPVVVVINAADLGANAGGAAAGASAALGTDLNSTNPAQNESSGPSPTAVPAALLVQDTVPIVSADQVTAPGEPYNGPPLRPVTSVSQPPVAGAPSAQEGTGDAPRPSPATGMTYAQMFQEIAQKYDLDWRVLAAQAYVESGFDSLALSGQGDMGLMQIRPSTWREWAQTVNVTDPFDSYSNVLVGAAYLDHLRGLMRQRGVSEREWMLVAYNWGPDKAITFLTEGGTWADLDPSIKSYVTEILRIAATIPIQ